MTNTDTIEWQQMTKEEVMNVRTSDKIRINGKATVVTGLYDRGRPDYGFDVKDDVYLANFPTDTIPHSAVTNEYYDYEVVFEKPVEASDDSDWRELTLEERENIAVGDELRINGQICIVTRLYNSYPEIEDTGFNVDCEVQTHPLRSYCHIVSDSEVRDENVSIQSRDYNDKDHYYTPEDFFDGFIKVDLLENNTVNLQDSDNLDYKQLFFNLIFNADCYNGHLQGELAGSLEDFFTKEELLQLCRDLEEYMNESSGYSGGVYVKTYADGSGSIMAGDYWKPGEHSLGHTDRTLIGFGADA